MYSYKKGFTSILRLHSTSLASSKLNIYIYAISIFQCHVLLSDSNEEAGTVWLIVKTYSNNIFINTSLFECIW